MELKAEHIHKAYGAVIVLDDISFSLDKKTKVGLVGDNGTGKSTLLKILAGEVVADAGDITRRHGLVLGYMPQDTSVVGDEEVGTYLRRVSGIALLEETMSTSQEAFAEYEQRDGYSFDGRMKTIMKGFGMEDVLERKLNTLSSGQKSKVFMVGVLLADPDVLLLDEPTNNLDLPALLWFERFLTKTDMSCIVVSHDRAFLDRVVRKIWEIDSRTRTLSVSNGTYSDYLARKRRALISQEQAYGEQREEISRLTESARTKRIQADQGSRYKGKDNDKFLRGFKRDRAGGSGKSAKAIEKRIDQIDRIKRPVSRDALKIELAAQEPTGSEVIELRDLAVGYSADAELVSIPSLTIIYGARVAILGLNGVGKSALLQTIGGELSPLKGSVVIGRALVVGNFTQEHQGLPKDETIFSFLSERTGLAKELVYALVTKFGFSSAQVGKPIGSLSPGGRARLLFALFSALSVNALLLDEPTNHLDLEALDALDEMLQTYTGTVVVVSHDRSFLEKFQPTDSYFLEDGQMKRLESLESYIEEAMKRARHLLK